MSEELPRRLSAVMFTDVVGYTALMQEDEEAARVVRLRHREALEAAIAAHGGELVQYLGDGSLSTFPSVVRAVSAAVKVQHALHEDVPLRIGVHQGEIAFDDQGIYGDSVNVASRIMGVGSPGSVLVSEKVHDELKNQRDFSTASLGQFGLKNVKHPLVLYAVEGTGLAVPTRGDLLVFSESTRIYKGVTQHWPKIALGAISIAVAAGFVLPDLAAGVSVQSYVFAWVATTAGLWFLFDKAESTMSARSRKQVAEWLMDTDLSESVASAPQQFIELFDSIFGDRHLTWMCFTRSSAASVLAVAITTPVVFQIGQIGRPMVVGVAGFGGEVVLTASVAALGAIVVNLIPDYLSLLETRWMMRFAAWSNWLMLALLLDLLATFVIGSVAWGAILSGFFLLVEETGTLGTSSLDELFGLAVIVGFLSTFFTSIWLWLYVLSIPFSRVLLRMSGGVGFLLRVADVERQPFRSMGFVSVIIASGLFALGLPLALL